MTAAHLELMRELAGEYVRAAHRAFGRELVAAALFGSVARGTARPESDLDLLLVVRGLPGSARRYDLLAPIERSLQGSLDRLEEAGLRPRFAAVLHTPEEAERHPSLYLDLTEDAQILFDPQGFLERVLGEIRARLAELGGHRVWLEGGWYWVLKRDYVPGEIIEI